MRGSHSVGDERSLVVADPMTATQIVQYAGAAGEFTALHHDDVVARASGYPGVFAHGMLVMGVTGRLLTDWFGITSITRYHARFLEQVWPGDVLTAHGTIHAAESNASDTHLEVGIRTRNQRGIDVLAATASVVIPTGS